MWAGQLGLVAQTEEQGSYPYPWQLSASLAKSREPESRGGEEVSWGAQRRRRESAHRRRVVNGGEFRLEGNDDGSSVWWLGRLTSDLDSIKRTTRYSRRWQSGWRRAGGGCPWRGASGRSGKRETGSGGTNHRALEVDDGSRRWSEFRRSFLTERQGLRQVSSGDQSEQR
jgi:hypothetical protein